MIDDIKQGFFIGIGLICAHFFVKIIINILIGFLK